MRKYEIKTIVYANTSFRAAEKCEIIGCVEKESSTGQNVYKLHSLDSCGNFAAVEDCVYATKEDALKAYREESAKRVKEFKSEIKNLKDLLEFPFKHVISGVDTDYDAERAYRVRTHELTGLILKGNEVSNDTE